MTSVPLWRLLLSLVYESVLLLALLMVGSGLFYPLAERLPSEMARHMQAVFLLLVMAAYFCWCWLRAGQTLPMKTWRIRLVGADGGAVGLRAAIIRFLAGLLIYLPLFATSVWAYFSPSARPFLLVSVFVALVAWCWPLWDRDRRMLHDRLAGTRLILV